MSEQLQVKVRESRGKRNARRMRASGLMPAILYGHGGESVSLEVSSDQLATAIRHGAKLVELQGGVSESALIRELQWDAFGQEVLHVDFMRVDAHERLTVEVQVELRGEAPGTKEGGILEQQVHTVELECSATSIPDKLHININQLQLDSSITAGEIEDMPEGASLITDAEQVIVHCVTPTVSAEEEEEAAGAAEPEVIGRKEEDESSEG